MIFCFFDIGENKWSFTRFTDSAGEHGKGVGFWRVSFVLFKTHSPFISGNYTRIISQQTGDGDWVFVFHLLRAFLFFHFKYFQIILNEK
jgi:hypothetical protein